ncbi:MAG: hypothetical protein Q7J48_11395 [Nocardioides sp.]|nr:hypothetical protein [Nocardioides sp.]
MPATAEHAGVLWRGEARHFWLHVPDVADYLVEDGATVTVQGAPGAAPETIVQHLLAAPQAVAWMMRGITVLDAAVAVGPHGAVAVAGHAGSGKSTLVAELLARGWALVADGVAPVVVTHGVPHCLPAARSVSCWDRADDVHRDWHPAPAPLVAMVLLNETQGELEMSDPRAGLNRFVGLHHTRYMGTMTRAVLGNDFFLLTAGEVARSAVPMVDLARPAGKDSRAELGDLVLGLLTARRP